jgi:multidrug efflux system membrane fusion protein
MNKILLILAVLMFSSCNSKDKNDNTKPIKVEVAKVEERTIPVYIEAIGNVLAHSFVKIRPQVGGILLKTYVKQGDYVKKGDQLFEIDPRPYQIALKQAEANLEKDQALLDIAKKVHERNKDLAEKEYISRLSFEQFQANLQTAEAAVKRDLADVETAKVNLGYCTISSPINGKVGVLNIYPGNLVVAGDTSPFIDILEISPIDVSFSVPQKEFQELQKYNQDTALKFVAVLPYEADKSFEGTIYFIDNNIDLQTGTILLKGLIENKDKALWPGEFVKVRVFLKEQANAVLIPESAVEMGPKGAYVYVVQKDQTVKVVIVEQGEKKDSLIYIKSGLSKGDAVVINGQVNLRNGVKVEVVTPVQKEEKK